MTRIYTRTGDDGTSALIGGKRVAKHSLRLQSYGSVDELNSFLGKAVAEGAAERLLPALLIVQRRLFDVGAELAMEETSDPSRLSAADIQRLEGWIDELTAELPPLTRFILPGGSLSASTLHVARTVCRRAERCVTALQDRERVDANVVRYLNRLSDLLFVMARYQNQNEGVEDVIWEAE